MSLFEAKYIAHGLDMPFRARGTHYLIFGHFGVDADNPTPQPDANTSLPDGFLTAPSQSFASTAKRPWLIAFVLTRITSPHTNEVIVRGDGCQSTYIIRQALSAVGQFVDV